MSGKTSRGRWASDLHDALWYAGLQRRGRSIPQTPAEIVEMIRATATSLNAVGATVTAEQIAAVLSGAAQHLAQLYTEVDSLMAPQFASEEEIARALGVTLDEVRARAEREGWLSTEIH